MYHSTTGGDVEYLAHILRTTYAIRLASLCVHIAAHIGTGLWLELGSLLAQTDGSLACLGTVGFGHYCLVKDFSFPVLLPLEHQRD
jgi:hypothetical protein